MAEPHFLLLAHCSGFLRRPAGYNPAGALAARALRVGQRAGGGGRAKFRPGQWVLTALVLWLFGSAPLRAQPRYWDVDGDSLARTLPRQPSDAARLRTLVHLLDLHPTDPQAVPVLGQLLALNQRLHALDDAPYRRLRAGVVLWHRGNADAAALDTLHAAVAEFDRVGRPIPWLLMDLVTLYNRLNRMAARKQYYDQQLAAYRLRGASENVAACYVSQGGYYRRMGDYNRTLNCLLRAADLAKSFSRILYVRELLVAGTVYADWGNPAKAGEYLRRARGEPEFRRLQGIERVFTFLALSRQDAQDRRYPDALRAASAALAVRVADSDEQQSSEAYALVQKAAVLVQMRALAAAEPLLRRAQRLDDSLALPLSGKPGEFELDATWAQYYRARGEPARAVSHWRRAYQKATAAKLDLVRPKYLKELAAYYDAHGNPAAAQRYARAYMALTDSINATQNTFHVAQYEGERLDQARSAQIADLRQAQAVQTVRLRLSRSLLLVALLAVLLVSGLGVFIYRELQAHRRTLHRLRQAQSQLVQAEKMAFLGELTAGIAHELQNPLTFMKKFAEVSTDLVNDIGGPAARDPGLEQEILVGLKQNLQQISQHGQRASSIIKDMLEHSRAGTGPRQATDLNALAAEALTLAYEGLRAQDEGFAATVHRDFDPHLGTVAAVPHDLGRVLLNLCTNALYAVRQRQRERVVAAGAPDNEGEPYEPTVTVRTRRTGGHAVEIRVRDNGVGMGAAVRGRVFEPFFTTKPAGQGTGLGLALAHDVVAGHGGALAVESREGEGTEFTLSLPA